ncbi:MAG TPA: M28 family metallopeptidase [Thermoanaerobaculia bacterium]|nr:M28 family metallopeptidase [Thermoanaerobaculia bacterium]
MRHVRTSLLIAVCGFVLSEALPAQVEEALAAIRPQAIRAHMRFLSDDLLEGRGTATRGYDIAARYVAARFEELGLEPAGIPAGTGQSYLQPVPMLQMTTVEAECSLTLLRDGREIELEYGPDYLVRSAVEEGNASAPVVFAGFGVTAPELGYDDYAGLDVRGKIVAILLGSPSTFPSDQRAYYSDRAVQARNAAARGAVGLLGIYTPERERRFSWEAARRHSHRPSSSWVDEAGKPQFSTLLPAAALSLKGAKELFAGAPSTLEEIYAAGEAGRPPAFELPVRARLRTTGRGKRAESPNVAAVLRGSDPKLRDEYVVLSAHLDHVGMEPAGTEGDTVDAVYNGAYDNASGIAVMLEVANAFTRLPAPRRSVLFLAVTGEEEGLNGSEYFAHYPTVPIDRIVANTNLDMFLMLYPLRDVIAFGAEHSSLDRVVREAAGRLGIEVSPDPFPEQVLFIRSDHYAFVKQGVPAIFLSVGLKSADPEVDSKALWEKWMQEVYHKPGDDMSQAIDFGSGVQFAKLNFLISYQVAQDEKPPAWNPGDFFGDLFGRPGVLRSGRP